MPMSDEAIAQRSKLVEFIQASLRALAALYVVAQYPNYFAVRTNSGTDTGIFKTNRMFDVMEFFSQMAKKYAPEVA